MIHLEKITPENWRLDLKVSDKQREYVLDSIGILARAFAYRESRSQVFVIYDDDVPIGMSMHCDADEWNAYELCQFFIDQRYQGMGFGLRAAEMILELMKADGKFDKVVLCYIEGDVAAKNLYEKLGFYLNGQVWEDEIGMEKMLR